ncbi:MAG: methytransferase partner Trm112 [Methanomicrobiaceae archaeon]|uniref:Trm112 family protein n=1 Tax=hydrocarbon metagenome TaxID=938273 RepID=A0A0W8FI08_9ZZZZ|nr:methytransferase partner Trm112 [Methanomicrobiaceae archaeon]MDD5420317.1 methytransferase partner Trm112 [Methanomicrobiaceae archaeon]
MRRKLLDIICCPVCKGDLVLQVTEEDEEEILSGSLLCNACRVTYEISEGIPNLLPRTASED